MKQKTKKKRLRKQINGKFDNIDSADENKYKILLQQFLPVSEAEILGSSLSSSSQSWIFSCVFSVSPADYTARAV
jgi:hypothetical protein